MTNKEFTPVLVTIQGPEISSEILFDCEEEMTNYLLMVKKYYTNLKVDFKKVSFL